MSRIKGSSWVKTFSYAWTGLLWAILQERNFKVHLVAGILAICLGWVLGIELLEWAVLFFAIFFVLVAEGFNTALEKVVDLASGGEYHSLAKIAKDVAAGAVLLAAINALIIGIIVLGSRIWGRVWFG